MEYHLTDLDKAFWASVKIHAIKRGMTVKGLILELLRKDMEQGKEEGGR